MTTRAASHDAHLHRATHPAEKVGENPSGQPIYQTTTTDVAVYGSTGPFGYQPGGVVNLRRVTDG
jgi:hypothetical protein